MLNLTEPTLLLDETKCRNNIAALVEKAMQANVSLRPHFKTHQSHEIGRWYRELGVSKITVSSLKMAEYFAADGWNDTTVAFPINIAELARINRLAEKIKLNVLIVSSESVAGLKNLQHAVHAFIEVDNGYHRTGVSPSDYQQIDQILEAITKNPLVHFEGFLSHAGHSYKATSKEEILRIHDESIQCMVPLKERYTSRYPNLILSTGDTPTCSVANSFPGMDEIRPGNLVFYDLTQCKIGSCSREQIAVAMACPIVAKYPERKELIIYGGGVHFSKDSLTINQQTHFGQVVHLSNSGWDTKETGMFIQSLSQEHGIIHASAAQMQHLHIGQFVGVLPVHSCLTADAMGGYTTLTAKKINRL